MWVEMGCTWLFMSLLILLALLLVVELVFLVPGLIWRQRPGLRRARHALCCLSLPVALGAAGWGMCQAFALPEVREITIALPHLQQPVKLAMLTDLHADRYKQADFFREVVNRTNALQADAIVITGDFEDGHLYDLAPALAPLRHLESRWGTFAVHGNHDYFSEHQAWERYLSSLGIRFLNNEHLLPGPGHLVLAGVTDPAARRDNALPPDLSQTLAGAPADKPIILLAHQPRIAEKAARHNIALQLSGHTHGGQMPGLRQLIAFFNQGLVQGLYRQGNMQIYISNATALWSGFPIRLFTPAEITLINLLPEHENK
jgi:predicted MPP superfamily phosphohydrolase